MATEPPDEPSPTREHPTRPSTGWSLLGLFVVASALGWALGSPFIGFVVVFAAGVAVLAVVERLRRGWDSARGGGTREARDR